MTREEAFNHGYRFKCEMSDLKQAYNLANEIIKSGKDAKIIREERHGSCRKDPTQYYLVYQK